MDVADRLRAAGVEVREVTAGSTPTGKWVAEVPGVTEVRAGNYVFNDLMQLDNGIADEGDDLMARLGARCMPDRHRTGPRLRALGGYLRLAPAMLRDRRR